MIKINKNYNPSITKLPPHNMEVFKIRLKCDSIHAKGIYVEFQRQQDRQNLAFNLLTYRTLH